MFNAWFELGGFRGEEIEEQMYIFAEEVMPELRRACGGGPHLPESQVNLVLDGKSRLPAGTAP